MSSTSLTRYLVEQQRTHGHIPAQLRLLIEVVARACKRISISVNKGELGGVLGTAGSENVQGEVQKKLDIIANEVLIDANEWGGHLAAMASEEMDGIYVPQVGATVPWTPCHPRPHSLPHAAVESDRDVHRAHRGLVSQRPHRRAGV